MNTFKQHSILPGFNLALGFTLLYLSLIVLIPLSAAFIRTAELNLAGILGSCNNTARSRLVSIDIWCLIRGSHRQYGIWAFSGLGAGALSFSRKKISRCTGGSSFCPANCSGRYCVDRAVCRQGLDRPVSGATRNQSCFHTHRDFCSTDLYRPAVCSSDRATRTRGY